MKKECLQVLESLHSNSDMLITKPDKGFGVVVMDKSDYILKVEKILYDTTKFELIGPSCDFDDIAKAESKIQRQLLRLKKRGLLPSSVYKAIKPTGSQLPRLHGLSKTHKKDLPLRPILSMIDSAQHSLTKWLTSFLDPALLLYSTNCIQDSTFAQVIRQLDLPHSAFLCSFDISSLFTNALLAETINICANALYGSDLIAQSFPPKVLVLVQTATKSVKFSFSMYQQIDDVAKGSTLDPVLANIFVGYYESLLFGRVKKPMYYRYVDDTLIAKMIAMIFFIN